MSYSSYSPSMSEEYDERLSPIPPIEDLDERDEINLLYGNYNPLLFAMCELCPKYRSKFLDNVSQQTIKKHKQFVEKYVKRLGDKETQNHFEIVFRQEIIKFFDEIILEPPITFHCLIPDTLIDHTGNIFDQYLEWDKLSDKYTELECFYLDIDLYGSKIVILDISYKNVENNYLLK